MKRVLIMTGTYIPGVKGGGPIQSIKNLVDNLSDDIKFYIITADRDLGDKKPYHSIKVDKWIEVGNAKVFYTDPTTLTWRKTIRIMRSIDYDVIYLNSFFSYKFSVVPLLLSKIKQTPKKLIVLAPRGQFSPGALSLKYAKKQLFINIMKKIGMFKNIIWHATAETEKNDIEKIFGYNTNITVANNLTADYKKKSFSKHISKKQGELKIVFVSRIHPKKNLKMALELLKEIEGKVEFNIYGPIEDSGYWDECKEVINQLSNNIKVFYKGTIKHDSVVETFNKHHVFLFPTLGENFGHVISEGLIGGCPVIISDQTPWRDLDTKNVGWDIPLKNTSEFSKVLQRCIDMPQQDYNYISKKAFEYGKKKSINEQTKNDMFNVLFPKSK